MRLADFPRVILEAIGIVRRTDLAGHYVADHPAAQNLKPGQVYIVGNWQFQKWALMRCPCGCGETIMLSLSAKKRPHWTATIDGWGVRPCIPPSARRPAAIATSG